MTSRDADRKKVGLPYKPFLYTLDQIAVLISLPVSNIQTSYIYYDGRSTGRVSRDLMLARNIAPPDDRPEWRVTEGELIRWMKRKGIRYYESGLAGR